MNNKLENTLFDSLAQIIEQGKQQVVAQVNSVLTLTYWHVGKKINEHVLNKERAEYDEKLLPISPKSLSSNMEKALRLEMFGG